MWNKFAETQRYLSKDPSIKSLGWALLLSAILHAFLAGSFNITLPKIDKTVQTIDARLQKQKVSTKESQTKPMPEKLPESLPKKEKLPKPKPKAKLAPKAEPETKPIDEAIMDNLAKAPPPEPLPDLVPDEAAKKIVTVDEPQPIPTNEPPPDEVTPQELGAIINQNAYQYVETDFDVRTQIDGAAQGRAKITYNLDAQQYKLKSLIEAKGLAALVVSDLLQTSEGLLTQTGLQPASYLYQYGNKTDKTYSASFDWQAKKVSLITSKGTKIEDLSDGTQDLLSFMYQFMHVAPLQRMQISIATGKKLNTYDYTFEGEEMVNTSFGELKTIHIRHARDDIEDKTELWLALDYQYIPIKIRKTEKNGKVYELEATHINTIRPPQNN